MALTRDVEKTFIEAAKKDPAYRIALLGEVATCLINGEHRVAKGLLRQYVEATIGLKRTAKLLDVKPESVARMFSSSGSMSSDNMLKLIASFHKREGVEPQVGVG